MQLPEELDDWVAFDILENVRRRLLEPKQRRPLFSKMPPTEDPIEEALRDRRMRVPMGMALGEWLDRHLLAANDLAGLSVHERTSLYGTVTFLQQNNILGPQRGKAFTSAAATESQLEHSGALEALHRIFPRSLQAVRNDWGDAFKAHVQVLRVFGDATNTLSKIDVTDPVAMLAAMEDVLTDRFNAAHNSTSRMDERLRIHDAAMVINGGSALNPDLE